MSPSNTSIRCTHMQVISDDGSSQFCRHLIFVIMDTNCMHVACCEKYFTQPCLLNICSVPGYIILENVTCMFGCTCLYSFRDQPEAGSSGSMMPVLIQRSSPLMFQHLQLSYTLQPTLEGLFSSALTILCIWSSLLSANGSWYI